MAKTKSRVRLDKLALFRDLGYEPHAGQLKVHQSRALRRVMACGTRHGKSKCAAMEAIAAAMEPKPSGSIGWIVAPTYSLSNKVFREIVAVAGGAALRRWIVTLKENDRLLVLRNVAGGPSEIRAMSADNPVSLLGEGLDWVIVDEAARLRPSIWYAHVSQRLIDKRGWALLISTPHGRGWFYACYRLGQGDDPDWESWNLPSWANPHLDREFIERERSRLPERVFAQEYGGEFVEGAGAVFRGVRDCATGGHVEPVVGARYWAGVDLARVEDYTVVCVLDERNHLVHWERYNRIDWGVQVDRIRSTLDRYNGALGLMDSTGIGDPIYESLRRAGCRVSGYKFTARSKADLINLLAQQIEKREITLPRYELWPEGVEELESYQYTVTEAGNTKVNAPPGYHDDVVVAIALAAWCRAKRMRPVTIRSFASAAELADWW